MFNQDNDQDRNNYGNYNKNINNYWNHGRFIKNQRNQ